jgi:glycosyltransferase involved in cell wall biosynthesis
LAYGWLLELFGKPSGANFKVIASVVWTDIGWPIRFVRRLKQKPVTTVEGAMFELERRLPIQTMITAGETLGPADIWVANDWTALPVAVALQTKFGGQIVYDSHEFGTQEYAQDWAWRKYERPIAVTIERHFIKTAKVITAVSGGIVEALRDLYHVDAHHEVVINAPPYQERLLVPAQNPVKVLYHGIVVPGRGLELLIDAAKYWGDSAHLYIRGPSKPEYKYALSSQILANNVANKVTLLEPVAMTELVSAASAFDLGIMALPGHSGQNRFALPNKIFEYLAAGLGLIVSDLPEMTALVRKTSTGLVLESDDVKAVASQIASLTLEQVNAWKQAALDAAKTYNGGQSAATLDKLYRLVLRNKA